jgi:HEAT repeat protein
MVRLLLASVIPLCLFPALAQDIQSPNPKQRAKAAKDLAKQGSAAIPRLEALLSDPVVEVRIEAVKSLVEIGTVRSLNPLIRATQDNDAEVQIRAADGLVNFYWPGYVQSGGISSSLRRVGGAIRARFGDAPEVVIDPFIEVRPEVIAALGKLVRGGVSMDSRANAARAVGVLRGRAALPDLYQGLRSKDDLLIYECLIAIQKIRDPSSGPHIQFLLRDLNERVQVAAIETTGLLRNREALKDLYSIVENPRTSRARKAALDAIAQIPDEGNRPLLTRFLQDRDDGLRAAAYEGLGRLNNPSDMAALEAGFAAEKKMNVRLAQAFGLVKLGKREFSEFSPLRYLVNTLNSRSWRGVASGYLVELAREASVREVLHSVLSSGSKDEKIEVCRILAQSGGADSVAPLEGLTKDPDAQVAQEALRAVRSVRARIPKS